MFVWPDPDTAFNPAVVNQTENNKVEYIVFSGDKIYQEFDAEGMWRPTNTKPAGTWLQSHFLGHYADIDCYVVEVEGGENFADLRTLFGKIDNFMFALAGRAKQVLDWFRSHQFCGRCGTPAEPHDRDRAMICRQCNIFSYPRLSPSIITLVHRGEEVLLARNHRFPNGMYSTLAGFVEPGESIENTLTREVKEEVGVNVKNLEYLGSQPWPFPNSLMLGFLAEYDSGDIVLQEEEIADAKWFHCRDLPNIPGKVAISRWIIDTYLGRLGLL